ncbi:MAG: hypothetical protein A3K77_00705 [Euryarchaeota archaeon RBG_13_31_8]|nr:MAG: hypothetical protein A3K77_00705 [Euryarchaeota archaeon RBG_13_31_8]
MNNFQHIVSIISGGIKKASASWDAVFLRNVQSEDSSEVIKKPYIKSTIIYTCISTSARAVSQCPQIIMQKTNIRERGNRNRSMVKVDGRYFYRKSLDDALIMIDQDGLGKNVYWEQVYEDDPWQKVFLTPNVVMSGRMLSEQIVSHLMISGNVWILGLPFDTRIETPDQLWPIKQVNIEPIKNELTNQLEGWKYKPNESKPGTPIHVDERIAHVNNFNPDDFILGLSPLKVAETPLKGEYKAARYNELFFENGARPDGILTSDKLIPASERVKLREEWRERHGGYKNAHDIAVLHSGLSYQSTGLSQSDMQYNEYCKWVRDEMCQILGIKKGVISITEELNYATLMGQKTEWWESTLLPMIKKIEEAENNGLLKNNKNKKVVYDLSNVKALQEDMEKKANIAQKYWSMAVPFNHINEKLELGFDPMPHHEVGYLPFSVVPVGSERSQDEEDQDDNKIIILNTELEKKYDAIWRTLTRKTKSIENEFDVKTKRMFFDARKTILNLLFTGDGKNQRGIYIDKDLTREELKKNIDLINEYNYAKEKEIIKKYSEGYYYKSIGVGADQLIDEIDIDITFNLDNPLVVDYIRNKKNKVVGITDTIKKNISDTITDGFDKGEGVKDIAERIRTQFNFATSRAKVIARTETFGAVNFGRHAVMLDSGFKSKEWFTSLDERVRETHIAMHGKKVQVDYGWHVGNSILQYPGDPSGDPEEIIQCRCIEVVVLN